MSSEDLAVIEEPLSSAAMRFGLFPKPSPDGLGPRSSRPLGLWHTSSFPVPVRPAPRYCPVLQVAVNAAGLPLVTPSDGDDEPKAKEWESKTYSDGDEGQEEDTWGWEEQ